ncbi:MAG: TRAP transporter small permease [Synergistaceae bacterium]|nr:TRAP transporter small permease [Synergistaceae bacterium]MBQ9404363.1 TRAP transporter small permease [Synergistaceae bacterium]MBQ9594391.1 TRAP transporter small permease [Synergistaceae bacterium]MBR0203270.1 TRAP transporter small permease [Synergistaceae bacterium]
MKAIKKILLYVTKAELILSALTFAIMVVCYFLSVVNRNFIKASMPWTEELALYCMVYMALIGMEVGLRDGTQVCVTALTDKLKGSFLGKVLDFIASLILIAFIYEMCNYGVSLVARQMKSAQTTPVMKIPMYLMYASLVIAFGISLVSQVLILIGKIFKIPMEDITRIDDIIDGFIRKDNKKEAA